MIFQPATVLRNPARSFLALVTAVPVFFLLWYTVIGTFSGTPKGDLHFLIPATSSNSELCKLLLSAQILHYPVPALINWGAPEAADDYVQHLAKIQTILNYLNKILETASDDDLVLILDGYDVWLQLGPDVLVKRYFKVIEALNARSKSLYGKEARHSILFGPDKICWPIDFTRPACWAVPHLDLDEGAFGPPGSTDAHNMPRWLNSGTIMGPLLDMRDMFQATLDAVTKNYVTDSDQFYFANVWGDQEYARLASDQSRLDAQMRTVDRMERWQEPDTLPARSPAIFEPHQRTEYYVSLDYLSELFQTLAFYKQFLVWMRPDHSWTPPSGTHFPNAAHYTFSLPEDVKDSPPPFSDLETFDNKTMTKQQSNLVVRAWQNIELCINTVTNQVPVVLHFTGEKAHRFIWWKKIWFQPEAKLLRDASLAAPDRPINGGKTIHNKVWSNGLPPNSTGDRSGAMGDNEEFLTWETLCGEYEVEVFG